MAYADPHSESGDPSLTIDSVVVDMSGFTLELPAGWISTLMPLLHRDRVNPTRQIP
jgi:hypothetical protein